MLSLPHPALLRRVLAPLCLLLALALALAHPPVQAAFGFEEIATRAQKLSRASYEAPGADLPKELRELSYDQYRDIRFKPERSIWRGNKLPFEVQLFHPGLYYNAPVKISMVSGGVARPLAFDPNYFDYGKNNLDKSRLKSLGYSGFRIHYPLNRPDYKDELLVFQGASYFRALGARQRYGLSARGLAVDTALHSGEEFPTFTEFWIEIPAVGAKTLTVYALLDSRRVTGAYKFVVRPGVDTVIDVQARLFLRESVGKLGIAPLTSMFFRGANQNRGGDDYRPEVHDSDGLLVAQSNGEWIWRPLVNPRRLITTSFGLTNPKGFGLIQRRRDFSHYEDLEARYDLRPSAWIEPKGAWGAGRVELVMIPTPDETNDNIVAYWVPNAPPAPGQAYDLQYRMSWEMQEPVEPAVASVVQTRRGQGYTKTIDDSERLIIDFEDPPPPPAAKPVKGSRKGTRTPPAKPEAEAEAEAVLGTLWMDDNGEVLEKQTYRNEVTGGWRMSFRFRRRNEDKPVEMRAYLKRGNAQVSETWSYILPPS